MNAAIPEQRRDQGSRGRYNRRMQPYVPFLTWRFDVALQFASGLHHDQARKGGSVPYIAHLMGVCALVLEAGGDEDQAIAALLHDSVEDQADWRLSKRSAIFSDSEWPQPWNPARIAQ